jgi:chromosome segregation protein
MFLKRLEIQGFKSFADKTNLEFDAGVVAIVGPNGSGKSNVADSLRWLLGERDARNLRGGKIEDLIFAGTESRSRMGIAQASLYFDNSSGFFPVPYKEVSISRRIERDGTSQFYLNRSEVRLKDVIDFFARARIGARGLTIISQGDSDMFIKATPLERRVLIEEILGLKEYQIKKTTAKRKLQNTTFNLEKANAMIDELLPRLRLLRRQAKRLERKAELEKELTDTEHALYGSQLRELNDRKARIVPRLKELDDTIQKARERLAAAEKAHKEVTESKPQATAEVADIQKEKNVLESKRMQLQKDLGRLEAELEFVCKQPVVSEKEVDLKGVIDTIRKYAADVSESGDMIALQKAIKRILDTIETAFAKKTEPQEESETDKAAREEIKGKIDTILTSIKQIDTDIDALRTKEHTYAKTLEDFNARFQESFMQVASEKRVLRDALEGRESAVREDELIRGQRKDLEAEIVESGKAISDFEGWSGDDTRNKDELRRSMYRLRAELASIDEIDASIMEEAKEVEERYTFLTEQVGDLSAAISDLEQLIKELDAKIKTDFDRAITIIDKEFARFIKLMFGGGKAGMVVQKRSISEDEEEEKVQQEGIEINIHLPRKRVKGLEVLSGGERSLVSIAALFALIAVSPPPFLVLDEVDAALDEQNARRFGEVLKEFAKKTQFIIITHNRATMEAAETLYGVTMSDDGTSRLLSLKLRENT